MSSPKSGKSIKGTRTAKTGSSYGEDQEPSEWKVGRRGAVHRFVESGSMKAFMGAVILLNAVQVGYECDLGARCRWEDTQDVCGQDFQWLQVTNYVYLSLYTVEMSLRLFVHRGSCFGNSWDVFDCVIIIIGILSELAGGVLPSTGILRLFRLARLAKAVKLIKLPPELHVMIHGFISAIKAIAMGAVLMGLMLCLWTIVAVECLNDLNHGDHMTSIYDSEDCPRCVKQWASVPNALLTLTRLSIMGEGWDEATLFIEAYPWSILIFTGVYFTVVLGMANLVLAVIVDKALQAHEEDIQLQARQKETAKREACGKFVRLCQQIDGDESGYLCIDELLDGYDNNPEFQDTLAIMDIYKDDMCHVFKIMDQDNSGDVSYNEFAHQLTAIKGQELQTMVSFVKHWVHDMRHDIAHMCGHLLPGVVSRSSDEMPHKKDAVGASPAHALADAPPPPPAPALWLPPLDVEGDVEAIALLRRSLQDQMQEFKRALERQGDVLAQSERLSADLVLSLRSIASGNASIGARSIAPDTTDPPIMRQQLSGGQLGQPSPQQADVMNTIKETERRLESKLVDIAQQLSSQAGGPRAPPSSWACAFPARGSDGVVAPPAEDTLRRV